MKLLVHTKFLIISIIFFTFAATANGQEILMTQVEKIKKNRLILSLPEGSSFKIEDRLQIVDSDKKIIADLLLIDKKMNRGLCIFKAKGKIDISKNYFIVPAQTGLSHSEDGSNDKEFTIGLHLIYSQQSIAVNQKYNGNEELVKMSGALLGFELSADYNLNHKYMINTGLGYENFEVKGEATNLVCSFQTTSSCYLKSQNLVGLLGLKMTYLDIEPIGYWISGGVKLKYSLSRESNSLNQKDIQYFHSLVFQTGFDYRLTDFDYLSTKVIYDYSLNTSSQVPKIFQIGLSLGYVWQF